MTFHRQVHIVRFGPPGNGVGVGHPFLGPLFFLIIVALVVWALVVITRHLNRRPHEGLQTTSGAAAGTSDALKILNERFARGEIDADDFTTRRDLLLQAL